MSSMKKPKMKYPIITYSEDAVDAVVIVMPFTRL